MVGLIGLPALPVIAAGALWFLNSPAGCLPMDINPSAEMSFNRMHKVFDIKGMNQDGKALIQDLNLNGQDMDNVAAIIIEALLEDGRLKATSPLLSSADDSAASRDASHKFDSPGGDIVQGVQLA